MDSPSAGQGDEGPSSQQANLLWTPDVENAVELWQQTGQFPFPELQVYPQPQWSGMSKIDLRLVHHVAQVCSENLRNRTSKITVWTELMPKSVESSPVPPLLGGSLLCMLNSNSDFSAQHRHISS
ncbi:MAG: hypothetical protein INR71_04090 [Terriglobus roseus]|nr:hypothetical protein [Terriglobus roseus]